MGDFLDLKSRHCNLNPWKVNLCKNESNCKTFWAKLFEENGKNVHSHRSFIFYEKGSFPLRSSVSTAGM
jgi:hypothetical protein